MGATSLDLWMKEAGYIFDMNAARSNVKVSLPLRWYPFFDCKTRSQSAPYTSPPPEIVPQKKNDFKKTSFLEKIRIC